MESQCVFCEVETEFLNHNFGVVNAGGMFCHLAGKYNDNVSYDCTARWQE